MLFDRVNEVDGNAAEAEAADADGLTVLDVLRGLEMLVTQKVLTSIAEAYILLKFLALEIYKKDCGLYNRYAAPLNIKYKDI